MKLKQLGVNFPAAPSASDVQLGLAQTQSNLVGKEIEDLIDLPEMTAQISLAAMRILSRAVSPAAQAVPEQVPLIACQQVNLSIKHGNAPASAIAYAIYGSILCHVVGDIEASFRFGKLALSVLERFNAKELQAKTLNFTDAIPSKG